MPDLSAFLGNPRFGLWEILNLINSFCCFVFRNLEEMVLFSFFMFKGTRKLIVVLKNVRCNALS